MVFIKKWRVLVEDLKGMQKRAKGEAKKARSWSHCSWIFLDLKGVIAFDLRASSPLSGFLVGLKSSRPLSTPLNGLGFAVTGWETFVISTL